MRKKIIVATTVAFVIGALLGPPDVVSQLILGVMTAFVCGVSLLILARFSFVKSASRPDPSTPRCSAREDRMERVPVEMTRSRRGRSAGPRVAINICGQNPPLFAERGEWWAEMKLPVSLALVI